MNTVFADGVDRSAMVDVIHTALWVSDVTRSRTFYVDGLGLSETRDFLVRGDEENVFLAGEGETELQLKYAPDHEVEAGRAGFDHFAVEVDDTDAMADRLEEFGGEVTRGPLDSEAAQARIAFVADPDGHLVELIQPWE